jgi:hypothetical protein
MACKHIYYMFPDRNAIPLCKNHYKAGIWCENDLFKSRCPFWTQEKVEVVVPSEATVKEEPVIVSPETFDPPIEVVEEPVKEPEQRKRGRPRK